MRGKRPLTVLVTVMVITAVLPAGIALAQEDQSYEKTVSDSPEHVVVDQSEIDGDFTVEVSAHVPDQGQTPLVRERLGPGSEKWIQFNNERVYENLTVQVTVHGSGSPNIGEGADKGLDLAYLIGSTGGDTDLDCTTADRIGSMANPYVDVVDCGTLPGETDVNTTDTDANQTKLDIYQSGSASHAQEQITYSSSNNYLNDAKTIALIKGKNAYIRALNNNSTQAEAETAAHDAAEGYHVTKQQNLIESWNSSVSNVEYLRSIAKNESGISDEYIDVWGTEDSIDSPSGNTSVNIVGYGTDEVTLADGTTQTARTVEIEDNRLATTEQDKLTLTRSKQSGSRDFVYVQPPSSEYNGTYAFRADYISMPYHDIGNQSADTNAELTTFVNNTYDEYQAGEINNSDLADPYVLQNEYSPGDSFESWAMSQLTTLGVNSPENLDKAGYFNITTSSGQYQGVLMSETNPASGQFENGTTYDPTAIDGQQYVVTSDDIVELKSNFTITKIRDTNGETRENVTIVEKQYETANVSEFEQLVEDLAYERAQIEAREQALGGGGWLDGGTQSTAIIALAAAAAVLLLKD